MNEESLELVTSKIFNFSGINIASIQKESLKKLIIELAEKHKISVTEYCNNLNSENPDFPVIINSVTVNETYFFREEKQFDILKNEIFPKFANKKMNIWCGACSTGEEPLSLLAMALSCNIDVTVYASDIDDNAISTFKKGIYSNFSFRPDGKKYHELLSPFYTKTDDKYIFNQDFINRVKIYKFNLTETTKIPFMEQMDLIFLRNVFIYFDKPVRQQISSMLASKLNQNGYLFYSMNEIGCLDERIIPSSLYKTNSQSIFYFVKGTKNQETENSIKNDLVNQLKIRQLINQIKEKHSNSEEKVKILKETKPVVEETIDVKDCFEQVCKNINTGDFEQAKQICTKLSGSKYQVYNYFLQGYTEYHADNKENAERLFSTAEMLQKDFWPAYFYHGLVLKDVGKKDKADFCFKKCIELIDNFGSKNPYDFILDSFSPSYIYSLCKNMMNA